MRYRVEVDGLRALAVLPVLFFHAGVPLLGGGFVGVDVFFVISGFLITGILFDQIERGDYSLTTFYSRRARRILPALVVMLVVSTGFALLWMLPSQLVDFSKALATVGLFSSNILFWRQSNYFASDTGTNPLLHTWSLAVEEQFYIAFPVILFLMVRYLGKRLIPALIVAALASFALCEIGWRFRPDANFYLAPTRAWELLAGSITALILRTRPIAGNDWFALPGIAAILAAVLVFDETTPFPSYAALAPVGGAVLILAFATSGTFAARLLSTWPMRSMGLISYSAYLWHQPLLAFGRIRSIHGASPTLLIALAACSIPIAYLSWRFVEQPFRSGRLSKASDRRVIATSAVVLVAVVAAGGAGWAAAGLPWRVPEAALIADAARAKDRPVECFFDETMALPVHPVAGCGDLEFDRPLVLLFGDSHADALRPELRKAVADAGLNFYATAFGGCPPIAGVVRVDKGLDHRCASFVADVLEFARSRPTILVLSARWRIYVDGARYDNGEGGREAGDPFWIDIAGATGDHGQSSPDRAARVLKAYRSAVTAYLAAGVPTVVVGPIPEAGWNVPEVMARRAIYTADLGPLTTSSIRAADTARPVSKVFGTIEHAAYRYVRPDLVLCDAHIPGRCLNSLDGQILYKDSDHVSDAGARMLVPDILRAVHALKDRVSLL